MEPVRSKVHKISAKAIASEVEEFARVAKQQAATGGSSSSGNNSSESGSATAGGSNAAQDKLAEFLSDVAGREDSIAKEAVEADAMTDEHAVDVVQ